jgi:hypothetical protein
MSKFEELATAFTHAQQRYSAGKQRMEKFVKELQGQFTHHLGFPANAVSLFSVQHPDRTDTDLAPDQALSFDDAHQTWHFGLALYPNRQSNQPILVHLLATSDDQKVRTKIRGQEQQLQTEAGQTNLPLATYIADVAAARLRHMALPAGAYQPIKIGME